YFADGCPQPGAGPSPDGGSDSVCGSQSVAINSLFTAGSIVGFVAPLPVGAFMDRYGPRKTGWLGSCGVALGALVGVFAARAHVSSMWYGVLVCLGFSSSATALPLFNVANLFPGHEGLALGLISGFFDSGTITFLIMERMYGAGVSLETIMIGYLCG